MLLTLVSKCYALNQVLTHACASTLKYAGREITFNPDSMEDKTLFSIVPAAAYYGATLENLLTILEALESSRLGKSPCLASW